MKMPSPIAASLLLSSAFAFCADAVMPVQVTSGDVAEALRGQGIELAASHLRLAAAIPSRISHPALEVQKVEPLSPSLSRVLIRCQQSADCIPFYAFIEGPAQERRRFDTRTLASSLPKPSRPPAPAPPLVKRGARVTLQMSTASMLITVPVICLQSGRLGEQIEVSLTNDRKRVYVAEIVSASLLRSRMEPTWTETR